jgi:CARDB
MRLMIALVAVLALGPATASSAGATAARSQLRSFVCQKALDPPTRAVSIQAVMRPVAGTAKMQIRFDLMRKSKPGAAFKIVRGHFLGSWLTPDNPTLGQRPGDVWIVNHPVVGLPAPATYRFRVTFRWLGSRGQQLSSAVQTSSTCYQPELRADLVVRSLTVTPLGSGKSAYVATIANRGLTAAAPVEVDLAGVGSAAQAQTLASVGPKSSAHERFVAPACTPGANLAVTVDPSHTIDEYDFTNNVLTMTCPASSPSS